MSPRFVAVGLTLLLLLSLPSIAQVPITGASASRHPGDGLDPQGDRVDALSNRVNVGGVVRSVDNRPVANARVEVHDLNTGTTLGTAYTSPNGAFEFVNVPLGHYEVVATVGVVESRERIEASYGGSSVTLRMPESVSSEGGGQTVSVSSMKVPGKARNVLRKAQEQLEKNNTTEARKGLMKALELYPDYAEARMLLGIVDLQEQQPKQACVELEKAIELDPNIGMAYAALGASYNALGRYDDALRTLDNGLRLAPRYWQVYFEMAKANLAKGDLNTALHQIDQSAEYALRDYSSIHLVRADILLGLKNYPKAVTELETFLNREPSGPNAAEVRHTIDQVKAFTASK